MFYDIYMELSKQRGISPSKAADEIGINRATVTNWKKKGATPSGETLAKIAEYFNVTVDSLLQGGQAQKGEVKKKENPQPQAGGENDIDTIVNDILNNLLNNQGDTLMLDGNPTSPKALEYLRESIRANVEHAKRLNEEERKKG